LHLCSSKWGVLDKGVRNYFIYLIRHRGNKLTRVFLLFIAIAQHPVLLSKTQVI
jgi:hypothetical protein